MWSLLLKATGYRRSQKPWDGAEKQAVWRMGQETSWIAGYFWMWSAITANCRAEPCCLHPPAFTTQPKAGSQDVFKGKVPWCKLPERTHRRWDCWRGGVPFTIQNWKWKHAHLVLIGPEIAVKPTAKEAFLQVNSWKHTSCQGPSRRRLQIYSSLLQQTAALLLLLGLLGVLLHTLSCWLHSLLLPCICQITALEWTGRHPSLYLALPGKPLPPRRCTFPGNSHPPAPFLTSNMVRVPPWLRAGFQAEKLLRSRASMNIKWKQELNTSIPLWVCTTGIRSRKRQSPAHLFIIKCLMHN